MTVIMTPGVQSGVSSRVLFSAKPKKKKPTGTPHSSPSSRPSPSKTTVPAPGNGVEPASSQRSRTGLITVLATTLLLGLGAAAWVHWGTNKPDAKTGTDIVSVKNLRELGTPLTSQGRDKEDFRVLAQGRFVDGTAFKVLPKGEICISDHRNSPVQVGVLKPDGRYTVWTQPHREGRIFEQTDVIQQLHLRPDGNAKKAAALHQALEKAHIEFALTQAWGPKLRQRTDLTGDGVIIAHVDGDAAHRDKMQSVMSDPTLGIAPKATLKPFTPSPMKFSRSAMAAQLAQPDGENRVLASIATVYFDSFTESVNEVRQAKQTQPGIKVMMMATGASPAEIAQTVGPTLNELGLSLREDVMADSLMALVQNPTHYPDLQKARQRYEASLKALNDAGVLPVISSGNNLPDETSGHARQFNLAAINTHAMVVGGYRPLPNDAVQPSTVSATGMGADFPQWNPTLLAQGEHVLINNGGRQHVWIGSSPAVGQASGLLALLAQQHPEWSPKQLHDAMLGATKRVGSQPDAHSGQGILSLSTLFPAK